MTLTAKFGRGELFDRQSGNGCDAVKALLSADLDVRVSRIREDRRWELRFTTFDFLKTKHVWFVFGEKVGDALGAQAYGINVPGDDGKFRHKAQRP